MPPRRPDGGIVVEHGDLEDRVEIAGQRAGARPEKHRGPAAATPNSHHGTFARYGRLFGRLDPIHVLILYEAEYKDTSRGGKMTVLSHRTLWSCLVFLTLVSTPAYAYLDPGSGSYILQLLLGGIAGVAVAAKLYWNHLLTFFRSLTSSRHKTASDQQNAAHPPSEDQADSKRG